MNVAPAGRGDGKAVGDPVGAFVGDVGDALASDGLAVGEAVGLHMLQAAGQLAKRFCSSTSV
jgi:hypothetical protein